jgi:hypothetical protein
VSIGLSAALAEYKKHRATVARLKRFCSTLAMASITLVLGSCAESGPPNLIASRHLDAVAASAPHLQVRPSGRRRDGLLGETSNTHNSGRVVEVMTKWLGIESEGLTPTTELAINYVVFSFLSDSAVNTSSIALGAAQTEVWRYGINRTWCRVLTLPFSTSTVMPLRRGIQQWCPGASRRVSCDISDRLSGWNAGKSTVLGCGATEQRMQ